jgi:hypothetical protein
MFYLVLGTCVLIGVNLRVYCFMNDDELLCVCFMNLLGVVYSWTIDYDEGYTSTFIIVCMCLKL